MSIGSRIKEARVFKKLTQGELADLLGVTKGAIANYENQVSVPKTEILLKLMQVLGCDANFLYQDEAAPWPSVAPEETLRLKKYRMLDAHGKEVVDYLLDKEWERCRPAQAPGWQQYVGMPVAARGGMKQADETDARWMEKIYRDLVRPDSNPDKKGE